jgi:transposase
VLEVERWAELRREHFVRGVSIRALAERTGLSRKTVRKALRSAAPPTFRCPERSSKLDPFKDEIHRLLGDDPRLPAVRVRELIAPLGFDGAQTIARRQVLDGQLPAVRARAAVRAARIAYDGDADSGRALVTANGSGVRAFSI